MVLSLLQCGMMFNNAAISSKMSDKAVALGCGYLGVDESLPQRVLQSSDRPYQDVLPSSSLSPIWSLLAPKKQDGPRISIPAVAHLVFK